MASGPVAAFAKRANPPVLTVASVNDLKNTVEDYTARTAKKDWKQ